MHVIPASRIRLGHRRHITTNPKLPWYLGNRAARRALETLNGYATHIARVPVVLVRNNG